MIDVAPPMLGTHDRQTGHNMPCAYDAVRFLAYSHNQVANNTLSYSLAIIKISSEIRMGIITARPRMTG
jgi:hypothetical protein